MKRALSSPLGMAVLILALCLCFASNASAFFINFEDGVEGAPVNDIAGVSFKSYLGYEPLYADIRTGTYNAHSDDLNYGNGSYHMNGYFSIWAGFNADARGVIIDFDNNDGTWFKTGYASASTFYLDAYLTDGSIVTVSGAGNLNSPMGYLQVNAASSYIDYVVIHDTGNQWTADDMSGNTSGVIPHVPEPGTLILLGIGLAGLAASRKKSVTV